jgi:hypothetical protein
MSDFTEGEFRGTASAERNNLIGGWRWRRPIGPRELCSTARMTGGGGDAATPLA